MDISNCRGSTSCRFRFFISASFCARAASRSAITSSLAFCSASSISTGQPASSIFLVILTATSGDSQIRCAGRHSSWRSVFHRKSSSRRWSFPVSGLSRVPRPTIWQYRLRTFVGRSTTMQSTEGQSHPSVSNIELQSTLYLPASKSAKISARSGLLPLTSAARNPLWLRMSRNF